MQRVVLHARPRHFRAPLAIAVSVLTLAVAYPCAATVYRVGHGQKHARVSQVAAKLKPGDVVEVVGDMEDSFILSRSGTADKPIIVRGVSTPGNPATRPHVTIRPGSPCAIICRGNWNVIEGLDISGAVEVKTFEAASAIYSEADNLVVRNCNIHHNKQGIYGDSYRSGSTLIEFCEFDSNGGVSADGANLHSVYLCSRKVGAVSTVQNCYFHDAVGGAFLKTRCTRNLIRYNWFENAYLTSITAVDTYQSMEPPRGLYPMHSDIYSNVFFQGWSPGPTYSVLSLGGESEGDPGTEGDFSIAHNLFVVTKRLSTPCVQVHGNVDRVNLWSNVFMDYGVNDWMVYDRGSTWDAPRTREFIKRRGSGEPLVGGANNWISNKGGGVPKTLAGTITGDDPRVLSLPKADFRPRSDSPLAGAGLPILPGGRLSGLIPEYEPLRGMPDSAHPIVRRPAKHPSIGPFETAE